MEKVVKASREYKCDFCEVPIEKGEHYIYGNWKIKEYTPWDFDQPPYAIGYTYQQTHNHLYDCYTPIDCQEGRHTYKLIPPNFFDLIQEDYEMRCTGCGEMQPDMFDLQDIDLANIKRHGQSNNL